MKQQFLLAIMSLALTTAAANAAGQMTGNDLQSLCNATDQVASTACRFYILGVVQGIEIGDGSYMNASRQMVERKKTILCMVETSQSEMVGIVKDAMRQILSVYPDDGKLPATASILAAMSRKYPCPR
jgi:Rap1a immunity proteins